MIFEVLQVITEEVNTYFGTTAIRLENIAKVDQQDVESESKGVFLTLLNMKEEYALKNRTNNEISNTEVSYKNPKVSLNLYLLFSANNSTYKESLKSLAKVIEFFQGKRIFTQDNTNFKKEDELLNVNNFRFIVDLFTPSFEELNFIWGTLGGKQYPSVIYKVSLMEIERDAIMKKGTVILELETPINNN